MASVHLLPLLSGILFSLANGRHHQEIGEKEEGEVGCSYPRFLPARLCLGYGCFPLPEAAGFGKDSCTSCFRPRVAAILLLPDLGCLTVFFWFPITQLY